MKSSHGDDQVIFPEFVDLLGVEQANLAVSRQSKLRAFVATPVRLENGQLNVAPDAMIEFVSGE